MSFPEGIRSDAIKVKVFENENADELSKNINDWLYKDVKGIFDIMPLLGKPGVIIVYKKPTEGEMRVTSFKYTD